ncbi:MAG: TnsA endonuclease N-terminal domain-containing protein [Lachnospiraceae bacterium]|nr:TnsA endonuclease N-terminal domain-containing protein [Lachnospiraceae bacterium]MDD7628994.1 TnsA endonuclease N-terminal domain-containing protein [Lachnospiraceae bacterium]MDY4117668.1 TnsA endonuclease N-terminal domain-containing protein [Lachnospiraceae bacterium]
MTITEKGKKREGRGKGDGVEYKPYIKAREFNSIGTCSNFIDWKNGKQYEFLSQTELFVFCMLRWDDDVIDIKEQYPLENEKVEKILKKLNDMAKERGEAKIKSPIKGGAPLTTDMLVIYRDGRKKAVSVKYDKTNISNRDVEKLWIEREYWISQGVEWKLYDQSDVNRNLVNNIMLVTEFYDESRVFDRISRLKHLIATKKLVVNMEDQILDFSKLSSDLE